MARTPTDPTKAQVWVTKGLDDIDFEFYFPQGPKGEPGGFTDGTELGAANLNQIVVPGVYKQTTAANTTALNNYPFSGIVASLLVFRVRTLDVIQMIEPGNGIRTGNVSYKRASGDGGTTWGSWRAQSTQRFDQANGRTLYVWDDINNRDQLVYGDTGWREISVPLNANGAVSGVVRLRRRGARVDMYIVNVILDTATTGPAILFTPSQIPLGFRPHAGTRNMTPIGIQNNALTQQWISNYTEITWTHSVSTAGAFSTARPSVNLMGTLTWTTDEPWPASLPGNAAGVAIPNL